MEFVCAVIDVCFSERACSTTKLSWRRYQFVGSSRCDFTAQQAHWTPYMGGSTGTTEQIFRLGEAMERSHSDWKRGPMPPFLQGPRPPIRVLISIALPERNFGWVQLDILGENLVIICWFYAKSYIFEHKINFFPVTGPLWRPLAPIERSMWTQTHFDGFRTKHLLKTFYDFLIGHF